ncbi:MAG: hypothetical protein IPH49_01380 [Ignavibacteria bacterium]|nr:hypothetical protein [Ignavibacteria bacterium]
MVANACHPLCCSYNHPWYSAAHRREHDGCCYPGRADSTKAVPVYVRTEPSKAVADEHGTVLIPATDARASQVQVMIRAWAPVADELRSAGDGTAVIISVRRAGSDLVFQADDVVAVDPIITLPYIMGLEERARIIFFHVPMSWVAVIAYLIAMIFAVRFLRSRDLNHDDMSMARQRWYPLCHPCHRHRCCLG